MMNCMLAICKALGFTPVSEKNTWYTLPSLYTLPSPLPEDHQRSFRTLILQVCKDFLLHAKETIASRSAGLRTGHCMDKNWSLEHRWEHQAHVLFMHQLGLQSCLLQARDCPRSLQSIEWDNKWVYHHRPLWNSANMPQLTSCKPYSAAGAHGARPDTVPGFPPAMPSTRSWSNYPCVDAGPWNAAPSSAQWEKLTRKKSILKRHLFCLHSKHDFFSVTYGLQLKENLAIFFPFFPRYPINALKLLLIFQPLVKTFWSAPQYQLESAAEKWAALLPASAAADLPTGNLGNRFLWEEGACADQQGELRVRGEIPRCR